MNHIWNSHNIKDVIEFHFATKNIGREVSQEKKLLTNLTIIFHYISIIIINWLCKFERLIMNIFQTHDDVYVCTQKAKCVYGKLNIADFQNQTVGKYILNVHVSSECYYLQ